jgi:hypothetical protein
MPQRSHFALIPIIVVDATFSPLLAQEAPKDIIAAHIRTQGYPCDSPQSAVRQPGASRPDEQVWLIKCRNGSYRVRLIPDMAAKVERIGRP